MLKGRQSTNIEDRRRQGTVESNPFRGALGSATKSQGDSTILLRAKAEQAPNNPMQSSLDALDRTEKVLRYAHKRGISEGMGNLRDRKVVRQRTNGQGELKTPERNR